MSENPESKVQQKNPEKETSIPEETISNSVSEEFEDNSINELKTNEIGEMVLTHLKDINEVAYIRFASVYRQFDGINDFMKTLESLKPIKKEQLASVI